MESYQNDPAIKRIENTLPEYLVRGDEQPTEEWMQVGDFNVHVDHWHAAAPKAVMVLFHGGGGCGRYLAPYARMAVRAGADAIAPDLPGYGLTEVPRKSSLTYHDWRTTASAVVSRAAADGLPVIVFGGSMGGLLGYDAVATTRKASALLATCFLDVSKPEVRQVAARWPWVGRISGPALSIAPRLTDRILFPMEYIGNVAAIANDPKVSKAILADRRTGGNAMPFGFLRTFLDSKPLVAPADFNVCPVILVHPADDRWTPVEYSKHFFDELTAPKKCVMLDNAGHFPVEQPGVDQLAGEFKLVIDQVSSS